MPGGCFKQMPDCTAANS